jgi:hypothetical protein
MSNDMMLSQALSYTSSTDNYLSPIFSKLSPPTYKGRTISLDYDKMAEIHKKNGEVVQLISLLLEREQKLPAESSKSNSNIFESPKNEEQLKASYESKIK